MKQIIRKKLAISILLIFILSIISSCATTSFLKDSSKVLETAVPFERAASTAMENAHNKGLITNEVFNEFKIIRNKFRAAYHIAVDALIVYKISEENNKEDITKIQDAIAKFVFLNNEMLTYTREFVNF